MAHRDGATGIVVITLLDPIFVVFVAPGDRFGEIRDALKDSIADVEALSTGSRRVLARGTLTLMDDIIDAQNGSVKLGATFDNKNVRLWPGLPIATRLTVAVRNGVLIPDQALGRGIDGLFVVGPDDKAARRSVKTSVTTAGITLVEQRVSPSCRPFPPLLWEL
jgi:multidrug efflux system membrane fusion protein